MNLDNKNILIAAQYAAPYGGNFILSVSNLRDRLEGVYNCTVAFAFPTEARKFQWSNELAQHNNVYFVDFSARKKQQCVDIVRETHPDLIYTHFEGFDTAMFYAALKTQKQTYHVWHMHDWLSLQPSPVKAAYQHYCFFKHYGLPSLIDIRRCTWPKWGGVKLSLLAVCKHEIDFVRPYVSKKLSTNVLHNGIDFNRLRKTCPDVNNKIFTFLAFGGRNIQKRIDLIISAAQKLAEAGNKFQLKITCGTDTADVIHRIFAGNMPEWLELIPQTSDIVGLFAQCDCFISSSDFETFSYAVAEATIFGLPVIQSDIEGTRWNSHNPSVYEFRRGSVAQLADTMQRIMAANRQTLKDACNITQQNNMAVLSIDKWSESVINHFKSL